MNGKAKSSRGDFTASEDDNVLVQGVSRDNNALGFFGFAYYDENKGKLKAVPIVNPKGKAVAPSIEAVMAGEYEPLARPIFIYVSAKSMAKPEVKEFVEYYLKEGGKLAKEVKYVPLGAADYKHALENFSKKKTGTGFGGRCRSRRQGLRPAQAQPEESNPRSAERSPPFGRRSVWAVPHSIIPNARIQHFRTPQ
jgi:phosphate transport system substrate-binding protein